MFNRILSLLVFSAVQRASFHLHPLAPLRQQAQGHGERSASSPQGKGDVLALVALVAALTTDPDPKVREHAATALGVLEDPRGCLPLSEALLRDPNPRVREHTAEALGALGDERARDALLLAMLRDPEPRVREHAAEALGMERG